MTERGVHQENSRCQFGGDGPGLRCKFAGVRGPAAGVSAKLDPVEALARE